MRNPNRKRIRKWFILVIVIVCLFFLVLLVIGPCKRKESSPKSLQESLTENRLVYEKGYNLPIDSAKKEEAKEDCFQQMSKMQEISTVEEKVEMLEKEGQVVVLDEFYSDMSNYEKMEAFLKACMQEKEGDIIVYEIQQDGNLTRMEFGFDGKDMYVLTCIGHWLEGEPTLSSINYNRVKQWEYTKKGWFSYEVCMPEYPEASETTPAYTLMRVAPWKEEYRRICKKYLLPIGYNGNTTFLVDWDEEEGDGVITYNAFPSYLGTSIPEITAMEEKEDGTVLLTIDAVCEMIGTDTAMTHQLSVRFLKNGKMKCLGNKILVPYS